MKRLAALFLLLAFGASAAHAAAMTDREKINALLDSLDKPGITFIRNGEEWQGAKGKDHLALKMRKMGKQVKTPEDFITKVGTSSSHTNQPYQVKTEDGKTVSSADWFHAQLKAMQPAKVIKKK